MSSHLPDSKKVLNADERGKKPMSPEQAIACPRCDSTNTKFCYYNNYSLSQPRHFCKSCRRYWTRDVTSRSSSPKRVARRDDHPTRYSAKSLDIEAPAARTGARTSQTLRHPLASDMSERMTLGGKKIVFFLDYDGTLSPIVDSYPEMFHPALESKEVFTTGELKAVRELNKEATPTTETLGIEAAARTGEKLAFSDPPPPHVLNAPPFFGGASITGGFGGKLADTGANPSFLSHSKDPPLKLFLPSLKMMGADLVGSKASYSKPAVTGYSNTNYGGRAKMEKLGDTALENHGAGTSQTVVYVAKTGTSENTAPLTAAANRPLNGNPVDEGIGRPVNSLPTAEDDVSENRNIPPSGNPEPNENGNQNGGGNIPTVVATQPSTSKWAEIFITVGAGGITTLYAAIDSKRYPTESKVVGVLLGTGFICGLAAMVLSNRVANRFLVNLGALCTYSATIGAMAMLLALNRKWVWGITGVCSLLFLLFLLVVAVLKRKRNTAPTAEV